MAVKVKGATLLESLIAMAVLTTSFGVGTLILSQVMGSGSGVGQAVAGIALHNDLEDEEEGLERARCDLTDKMLIETRSYETPSGKVLIVHKMQWIDE